MQDFRQIKAWKKAILMVKKIYAQTKSLPDSEKYGLVSQMNRSAISIPSNIAEGAGRGSTKEFAHFLNIGLGSAFELHTQLILLKELNFIVNEEFLKIENELIEIQKMIFGYRTRLLSKKSEQRNESSN